MRQHQHKQDGQNPVIQLLLLIKSWGTVENKQRHRRSRLPAAEEKRDRRLARNKLNHRSERLGKLDQKLSYWPHGRSK